MIEIVGVRQRLNKLRFLVNQINSIWKGAVDCIGKHTSSSSSKRVKPAYDWSRCEESTVPDEDGASKFG